MTTSTIIIIVAALLVAYAIFHTVQKFRGKAKGASCCGSAEAVSAIQVEDTDKSHYPYHYKLTIEEMMCSNCARNVENTLNSMDGVWAHVDLGRKEANVLSKSPRQESDFQAVFANSSYRLAGYREA